MSGDLWTRQLVNPLYFFRGGTRGALAAATGTAKTPKAVECEASQSGPKGNAQPLGPSLIPTRGNSKP